MTFIPRFTCPKRWQEMGGDERQRFCEHCKSNVYNLDLMSAEERLQLMSGRDGHACGRYRVAIRRSVPGYERHYMHHLLTHGVGVGAASGVLLALWQLWGPIKNVAPASPNDYFATASTSEIFPMPRSYVQSCELLVLGGIAFVPEPELEHGGFRTVEIPEVSPTPIRITFNPENITPGLDDIGAIETIPSSIK